jgi:cytochrome c553
MSRSLSTFVLIFGLVGAVSAYAAGNPAKGEEKAKVACAACHGAHGESAGPDFPKLAGQPADYLEHALKHYKGGVRRKNAIMMGMAAGLSEQDMADLAAYFSAQEAGLYTKY